jgi:hypothetical protein
MHYLESTTDYSSNRMCADERDIFRGFIPLARQVPHGAGSETPRSQSGAELRKAKMAVPDPTAWFSSTTIQILRIRYLYHFRHAPNCSHCQTTSQSLCALWSSHSLRRRLTIQSANERCSQALMAR